MIIFYGVCYCEEEKVLKRCKNYIKKDLPFEKIRKYKEKGYLVILVTPVKDKAKRIVDLFEENGIIFDKVNDTEDMDLKKYEVDAALSAFSLSEWGSLDGLIVIL